MAKFKEVAPAELVKGEVYYDVDAGTFEPCLLRFVDKSQNMWGVGVYNFLSFEYVSGADRYKKSPEGLIQFTCEDDNCFYQLIES